MDNIAIDMVDSQSPTTRVEGRLDPFWTMISVPQLGGYEQVLPLKRPRLERFLDRIAHRFFIAVALRTIEMPESHLQCSLGSVSGCERIRNQRAKPHSRKATGTVGKMKPCIAKRIGRCHAHTPLFEPQLAGRGLRRKSTSGLTISMANIGISN